MLQMQRTHHRNTVGSPAQSGWPLIPRGPFTNSKFSIRLFTMNRKASEMIAR
jgi:hypothetical protein